MSPVIDDTCLDDYAVGTVLHDGDVRFVVLGAPIAVIEGSERPCIYADPETTLNVISRSVPAPRLRAEGREEVEALVSSLPVGSVFIEDDDGRLNTFVKIFGEQVAILNGNPHPTFAPYSAREESVIVTVITSPTPPIYGAPRCGARHDDSEDQEPALCTLPAGHPPVVLDGNTFEHAKPSGGVYWNMVGNSPKLTREQAVTRAYNLVTGNDDEDWTPGSILAALYALYDEAARA